MAPAAEYADRRAGGAVALPAVPVFLFARARLPFGPSILAHHGVCAFWACSGPIAFERARKIAFDARHRDGHPGAIRRHWPLFWTMAIVLTGVKEDLIPLVVFFGIYLSFEASVRQERCWRSRGSPRVPARLEASCCRR